MDAEYQDTWPPRDPTATRYEGPEGEFTLPASPWTFEGDSLNPDLKPSNARLRSNASGRRKGGQNGVATVPPYHPDYNQDAAVMSSDEYSSSDSDDYDAPLTDGRVRVRTGSEGYEVRPVGREDMLARYLEELGEVPGRYHRYIPQPESESEDDNVPLAQSSHAHGQ